eukprot:CAMPEP_0175136476 /NCGR_PEP_ID=MMETSP0087-20121206/9297_1 /TAXON_ID=136419 /ORGANISM="Unknown Unknown, Strain D1" /LENGTH=580 /DNA_ID=CAMNT_0016419237 /DNA_START=103 /DNA_END=1842 /DNA_ORIENTATION=-
MVACPRCRTTSKITLAPNKQLVRCPQPTCNTVVSYDANNASKLFACPNCKNLFKPTGQRQQPMQPQQMLYPGVPGQQASAYGGPMSGGVGYPLPPSGAYNPYNSPQPAAPPPQPQPRPPTDVAVTASIKISASLGRPNIASAIQFFIAKPSSLTFMLVGSTDWENSSISDGCVVFNRPLLLSANGGVILKAVLYERVAGISKPVAAGEIDFKLDSILSGPPEAEFVMSSRNNRPPSKLRYKKGVIHSHKHCTYEVGNAELLFQDWVMCRTCNGNSNIAICRECAATCHANCELLYTEKAPSRIVCDCGAGGSLKTCQVTGNSSALDAEEEAARDEMVNQFVASAGNWKPPAASSGAIESLDTKAMQAAFMTVDTNHSGKITPSQLCQFLQQNGMGDEASAKHVNDFVNAHQKGDSETIDFNDFMEEFIRMQNFVLFRSMQTKFAEADKDHNGSIDKQEFHALLTQLIGEAAANSQVDTLFNATDTNHDGVLSLHEFATWYCTHTMNIKKRRARAHQATAEEQKALDDAALKKLQDEHKEDLSRMQVQMDAEKSRQDAKLQAALAAKKNKKAQSMQADAQW